MSKERKGDEKMINRIIWKVLLMFGGSVGSVYSCAKFVKAYSDLQECLSDNYSVFLGPWIEEYQSDAVKFGVFSVVFIVAFIIGCGISVNPKQNDSDEESN